jgi:hypothetical protein
MWSNLNIYKLLVEVDCKTMFEKCLTKTTEGKNIIIIWTSNSILEQMSTKETFIFTKMPV